MLTATVTKHTYYHPRRTEYEASIGSLSACGRTAQEAKSACEHAVVNALTGSYEPVIIRWGGIMGVAYRTPLHGECPEEWTYTIASEDEPNQARGRCTIGGKWTRATVEQTMRAHMAQWLGGEAGAALLQDDPAALREHWRYEAWQQAYAAARTEGYGDDECRRLADQARYAA